MNRSQKISVVLDALRAERRTLQEDGDIRGATALAEFVDNAGHDSYVRLYDILEAAIEKVQA